MSENVFVYESEGLKKDFEKVRSIELYIKCLEDEIARLRKELGK